MKRFCMLATLLVTLAACNEQSSQLPEDTNQVCVSMPASYSGQPFIWLQHEAAIWHDYGWDFYREQDTRDYFYYPDLETFVRERQDMPFGRSLWTEHFEDVLNYIGVYYENEYDESDRLVKTLHYEPEMERGEIIYDTWDDKGRPIRGFASEGDDYSPYWCIDSMHEMEYDDAAATITIRKHAGSDWGDSCGPVETVRITYAFYPFVMKSIEYWDDPTADTATTPDEILVNEYATEETTEMCFATVE